jgi:TPR repeat protein
MGVPRDIAEGTVWVKNAAEAGSVNATYQYARRLETGFGNAKNEREAMEWYKRAAMRGHPAAQLWLGSIGDGSLASSEANIEALVWLNLASRSGPAETRTVAQQRLRDLQKNMVPSDITEAQTRVRAWKPAPQLPGLKPDPEYDLPGGAAQSGGAPQGGAQLRRGGG